MIIINKETLARSIAKDVITFILVILLGYINYKYLGNSEVINVVVLFIAHLSMKNLIRDRDLEIYDVDTSKLSKIVDKLRQEQDK